MFTLLLICSMGVFTRSTPRSNGRSATRFVQSEPVSVSAASYLSAPASSPSTGCFFDTAGELIRLLDTKVEKYSEICNLETKTELLGVKDLLATAKHLGQLKAKMKNDPNYLLTVDDKILFSNEIFPELSPMQSATNVRIEDIDKAMNVLLKESWNNFAAKQGYPYFMKEKAWILAQFGCAREYLIDAYSHDLDSCLPVKEDIKSIVDLVAIDLNEEYPPLTQKEMVDKVKIDPYGFDFGGYALAFWIKEDNSELIEPIRYVQGFLNNTEVFNFRLECCRVNHIFQVASNEYQFYSSPTCAEYAFVLIAFEKDCETYKITASVRLANTNLRYNVTTTQPISAELIENLQISLVSSRVKNPTFFTHFKYSQEQELRILSQMSSSFFGSIDDANEECKGPSIGGDECIYYNPRLRKCDACSEGYYLDKNGCVKECSDGSFVYEGMSCKECEHDCKKCKDEETCSECNPPYGLYNGNCYEKCPEGTYYVDGECKECLEGCMTCSGPTSCGECKPGKYLCQHKCVDELPTGTYPIQEKECGFCKDECKSCVSYDICDDCKDGYFLYEDRLCVKPCPHGFREDKSGRCAKCIDNCRTCSADNQCDECADGYVLENGVCVKGPCSAHTVEIKKVCVPCGDDKTCTICNANNIHQCEHCDYPLYVLPNKTCGKDCGYYYYANQDRICKPCNDPNCMLCNSNKCSQCKPGTYLLNDIECVYHCPDGYVEYEGVCKKCENTLCKKCNGKDTNICTSCYYPDYLLKEGECVAECGDYFYQKGETCDYCIEGCISCVDGFTCAQCDIEDGFYLLNGICVSDCGEGYRRNPSGYCEKCSVHPCSKCDSSVATCDVCVHPYVLYNNICYETCPPYSYLPPGEKKCKPCPQYCQHCIDEDTCTQCEPGRVLEGSTCETSCNEGRRPYNGVCAPCENTKCKRCEYSPKICESCPDNTYLYEGDCYEKCPKGTYAEGDTCKPCDSKCTECEGSADNCKGCVSGLYDADGIDKCPTDCPPGNVQVGNECKNCTNYAGCNLCKADDLSCCVKPNKGFVVYECDVIDKCPLGTYEHDGNCYKCIIGCESCVYNDPNRCIRCQEGYFLKDGICVAPPEGCGDGYVEVDRTCRKCAGGCKKCKPDDVLCCTECPHGRFRENCGCDGCSPGYFGLNEECHKCQDNNCAICSSEGKICDVCLDGYVFLNGKCVQAPCPDGTKDIDGKCIPCEVKDCQRCDTSTKECDYCAKDTVLVNHFECGTCPSGTYKKPFADKPNFYYCESCMENCKKCTQKEKCDEPEDGNVLQDDKPQKSCDEGYYPKDINGIKVCVKCSFDHCGKCSATDCYECKDKFYLQDNTGKPNSTDICYEKCPTGTYTDELKRMCLPCPIHCTSCSSKHKCETCEGNYVITPEGICDDTCPDGSVNINGKCELCEACDGCKTCQTDKITCERCQGTLKLKEQQCVDECGAGYYELNGICYRCIDNCRECTDGKKCKICDEGFNLYDERCVKPCPDGYFGSNGKCMTCNYQCKKCNEEKTCQTCYEPYVEYEGICYQTCPVGTYNKNPFECSKCGDNCLRCNNFEECISCTEGYYLWQGKCIKPCYKGQIPIDGTCSYCVDHCDTCGKSVNECAECEEGYYKFENRCVKHCETGYYPDGKVCKKCKDNCLECDNATTCKKCKNDFYLHEENCIHPCLNGYSPFDGVCHKCTVGECSICNKDVYICDKCNDGLYLYNNTCYETCPTKTYPDKEQKKCKDCKANCATCEDPRKCITCVPPLVKFDDDCKDEVCPSGYAGVNGECQQCETGLCDTCNPLALSECIKCQPPYYLKRVGNTFTCEIACGEGYYEELGTCKPCPDNCKRCKSADICEECYPPHVLFNGICAGECRPPFVPYEGVCYQCHKQGCLNCDAKTRNDCIKCELPYIHYNGDCVEICPDGTFKSQFDDQAKCEGCKEGCEICENSLWCKKCKPGYVLFEENCIPQPCPDRFVDINGVCHPCTENCINCAPTDPSICSGCMSGYFLLNETTCVYPCPDGYFGEKGKCVKCNDVNCLTCISKDKCGPGGCKPGYLWYDHTCVSKCPEGYYAKDGMCHQCTDHVHCLECYPSDPSKCIKCRPGTPLFNYKCYVPPGLLEPPYVGEVCPEGYFLNADNECQACSANCKRCKDIQSCKKCYDPFVIDSFGNCVECEEPRQVKVNGECKTCNDPSCVICKSSDLTICEQCDSIKVIYEGKCLDHCPPRTYLQGRECKPCENNCEECYDAKTCKKCISPYKELKGDCREDIPPGHGDGGDGHIYECTTPHCDLCIPPTFNECVRCPKDYPILYEKKCIKECPPKTFYDAQAKTCMPCISNCIKCTDAKTCDSCDVNSYRYPKTKQCLTTCPDGTYVNSTVLECYDCQVTPCLQCSPHRPSKCEKCPPGYYQVKNDDGFVSCVTQCEDGYFPDGNTCIKCPYPCSKCTNSLICTDCLPTFSLYNNTCGTCPEHTVDVNGECYHCQQAKCLKCPFDDLSKCEICEEGTFKYKELCVNECPPYHYVEIEGKNKVCKPCKDGCATCNATSCITCLDGLYFYEYSNDCISCTLPSQPIGDTCRECSVEGCAYCVEGDPDSCRVCKQGFNLLNGKCGDCPTGYFEDGLICSECDSKCVDCDSLYSCKQCKEPFVLFEHTCLESCPQGYRNNNGNCEKCTDPNCIHCNDAVDICNECLKLPSGGYYLYEDKCYNPCPEGTGISEGKCVRCPADCTQCYGTVCGECIIGKYLHNDKCVPTCPEQFYIRDNKYCTRCSEDECLKCPGDKCEVCIEGTFLDEETGKCGGCKEGFFGNPITRKCEKCEPGCASCTEKKCLRCLDSHYFYNDKCVIPCPIGTTPMEGACIPCTQDRCFKCGQFNPDHCIDCKEPYLKYKELCVDKCPLEYYPFNRECHKCTDPLCLNCSDEHTCIECKDNFVLLNGKCVPAECNPGEIRIGDKCEHCKQESCEECALDLEKCYKCFEGFYLYNHFCEPKCPDGTYANKNTRTCEPCDYSCKSCSSENTCDFCREGYYYHEGVCLINCPKGFYEDCTAVARRCAPCDESCDGCTLNTNKDCINCKEGYYFRNHECISTEFTPTGSYFNGTELQKCGDYCLKCLSPEICETCNRGFNLVDNKCVKAETLTPVIDDFITVDRFTATSPEIRPSERLCTGQTKGTGVGSPAVTYSFYLRSLQPNVDNDLTVLAVNNPNKSGYNLKFVIDKEDNQCKYIITDEADQLFVIPLADCSYTNLYNWKFFVITLLKHGSNFVAKGNTINDKGQLIEKTLDIPGNSHTAILEPDSYMLLNEFDKDPSSGAFQIGKLNVMDYYPTEDQITKLYSYKPSQCDYFCTTCNDVCLSCPNGIIPTDNHCPAHYIYEKPKLFVNPTEVQLHLRDFITGKLITDAYGFSQWFYVNEAPTTEPYTIYKINYAGKLQDTPYINCQIINGHVVFNGEVLQHTPFKQNQWYFISVNNTQPVTYVTIRDTEGYQFQHAIKSLLFVKQFEDFVYTTHVNTPVPYVTAVLNTKIYLNNMPSANDLKIDYTELSCSDNCVKCDEKFKCLECTEGFVVEEGNCVEDSPKEDEYVELVNIYDLWNNEAKAFSVPFKDNLTIALNIRKKTHSNIYKENKKYTLLGYTDNGYTIKPLITETFIGEFISEYNVVSEDGNKAWRHNYTEEITDFITVVITVNKYDESITFIVNDFGADQKVQFTGYFTGKVSKIVIGDSKGYEMNTEISNLRVFDGLAGSALQESLQEYPKYCKGNCERCDFKTGLCLTCSFDNKASAPRNCGKVSYNWYPAYLFGYNDWSFTGKENHKFYLKNFHTHGVNAETYSLYGLFQMFRLAEGARYRVACVNNDELKVFRPENNRGFEVLCLDVHVQEGTANLILRVLDGLEYVQIPIKNFGFTNKDWVSLNANVDLHEMLLRYDFMKNNNETTIVHGEYAFKHIPEKIQKSASITVHGANDNIDKKVYSVPHINDYQIALIPHDIYNSSSVTKTKALLVQPECGEGCDACVWDVNRQKGLCFECMQGYDKKYVSANSAQLTCSKSSDKLVMFKGEIVVNTEEYQIPKQLQNAGQWSVYFQVLFNFGFWKFEGTTNVLSADGLVVAAKNGLLYVIVDNTDTVEIPLNDPYNTWNHVLLSKIGTQLKVTVNAGTYVKEVAIKSNALASLKVTTLKLRPVGYFLSFYAPAYTTSTSMDFIKVEEPFGYTKCGLDCAYCEKGVCKVCGNGYNADGTCKNKRMTLMPGYYAPKDNVLTLKYLLDTDIISRFVRVKNWTYQFVIEYDKMITGTGNFVTFLNYNGIDSITSTLNMQNGQLTLKLWPIDKYVNKESETIDITLPTAPKNPIFFVSFAYDMDKSEFRVVFGENQSNYAEKVHKVQGFLGYFGVETSALHSGSVYASIASIEFDYKNAATIEEMKAALVKTTRVIQKDCANGTPTKCVSCKTGTLSNGLCVPPKSSASLITQFREYFQVNPYVNNKSYKTSMPNLDSFTLMFMFRLNSLIKTNINLLKMTSSVMKDVLTIDYNEQNDKFVLSFYQVYQRINAGPLYSKTGAALDWVTFALAYDVLEGKVMVKIMDTDGNVLFKGNSALPAGSVYPAATYIYNIGYNEVQSGSFEFTALEFFDHVLTEDEIEQFRFNSLRKTEHGCKAIVNGLCNDKLENEIDLTSKVQTSKAAELFSTLYEVDEKYYAFNKYLISLEVNINTFNKGTYTANPSTLFLFTDEITDETISLDKAQPIPKSAQNAGLSLSLDGNTLIIRAPNLPWYNNEQQTFVLRFSDPSFKSNVIVSILGDADENTLSLLVQYDGNSYFYDVTFGQGQKVPLIGFGTLVYGHPALEHLSINFNTPRLDFNTMRYGKNVYNNCVVGMKGSYCPRCISGFKLFTPICKTVTLDQSSLRDQ